MAANTRRGRPTGYANREMVAYALFLVGGATRRVHTEEIALKCHELFPASFSWTHYPEIPDKDIVRVALTDARKESYGALVEGRAGQSKGLTAKTKRKPVPDGWILTEAGLEFLKANGDELAELAGVGAGEQKTHRQAVLKRLKRITDHPLFHEFLSDPESFEASIGPMADLLRCRVDAEPSVWLRRFESLRNTAAAAGNDDVIRFVQQLEQSYQKRG